MLFSISSVSMIEEIEDIRAEEEALDESIADEDFEASDLLFLR
jgi:hypothetical protein